MATREEIERLKAEWLSDPIWDIEKTLGFEDHVDELRQFRAVNEKRWEIEMHERLVSRSREIGTDGNLLLTKYLLNIEARIDELRATIIEIEAQCQETTT